MKSGYLVKMVEEMEKKIVTVIITSVIVVLLMSIIFYVIIPDNSEPIEQIYEPKWTKADFEQPGFIIQNISEGHCIIHYYLSYSYSPNRLQQLFDYHEEFENQTTIIWIDELRDSGYFETADYYCENYSDIHYNVGLCVVITSVYNIEYNETVYYYKTFRQIDYENIEDGYQKGLTDIQKGVQEAIDIHNGIIPPPE